MDRNVHTKEFRTFAHNVIRIQAIAALLASFFINLDPLLDNLHIIETEKERRRLLKSWELFERMVTWEDYFQIMLEIVISREIDGFLTYLSQILLRVFSEYPYTFKSFFDETGRRGEADKKVGMRDILDYLLQYDNTKEVIKQLAQDQIDSLAHKGLDTIIDDVNGRLKLGFDKSMPEYKSSCELVEIRNIIAHNGCHVSKIFLKRTQRSDLKVGDKFTLSDEFVKEETGKFIKFADVLDRKFISHFKLTTDEIDTEDNSQDYPQEPDVEKEPPDGEQTS